MRLQRTIGLGAILGLLLPGAALGQEVEGAPSQVSSPATSTLAPRPLMLGTHDRLVLESDLTRVAVGRSDVVSFEILTSRELLVLGSGLGRTSLVIWFADGQTETVMFEVMPDLSLLQTALAEIHPSIRLELAPDRLAYVLRGLVPDVTYRQAAEAAATSYLSSSRGGAGATSLVQGEQPDGSGSPEAGSTGGPEGDADPGADGPKIQSSALEETSDAAVINLIQLESLPDLADEKIREALEPLTHSSVTVRRVRVGDFDNDAEDLFVLEGEVPDQVTLTRALFLASRALGGGGGNGRNSDIRVLADEAGALTQVQNVFGARTSGGGGAQANQSIGVGNVGQSGGQGGQNQALVNRIGSNLGRAKVVEAADGRILSMIRVVHLPLVRVDLRLYEVNLSRLRQWRNELGVLTSDFDQGGLNPPGFAEDLQGSRAAGAGQDDVQNFLGFLDGGFSNQLQLVSGGFAVDDFFQLLVSEQVARSLSRPSLTVLSGEQAVFGVGGQIPVPVALTVGGGADQVLNGVDFRNFGVQLSVRPMVEELDGETITLDVAPSVTLPDLELTAAIGAASGQGTGTTAFETRGVRTHTRLRDGDSMLIGGLISQRDEKAQGKTPGLGDLPLAGWLFNNESGSSEEFELVVVVNPVIVRPERLDARLWSFSEPADVLDACLSEVRGSSGAAPKEDLHTFEEESGKPGTPQP